jgi:hypothetical protein
MTTTTPPSSNIEAVRAALMATLHDLRNRENPMDLDRAKAVAHVANVMIESAKVEVAYLNATGQRGSDFMGHPAEALPPPTGYPAKLANNSKPQTNWVR